MQDILKDFALRVQQMREVQRAYYIQSVAAKKIKTAAATAEAENILEESRRLEKLVDESVSMITMTEMYMKNFLKIELQTHVTTLEL